MLYEVITTSLMMDEYDTENMLREEGSSWFHRKNLSNKIGKGHYSMTVYDKLVRITMPLGTDNFIVISLSEINEHPPIVKHVITSYSIHYTKLYEESASINSNFALKGEAYEVRPAVRLVRAFSPLTFGIRNISS